MRLINFFVMLSVVVLMMGSCAHKVEKAEIPQDSDVAMELRKLEAGLNEAKARQVDLLSPDYYKKAEKSYDQARNDMEDNDATDDVLDSVAYGVAYLEKAEEVASIARADMMPVLTAREKALRAEAQVYMPSKLNEIDKDLKDITEEYERRNKKIKRVTAKQMTSLQNQYIDLEAEVKRRE